MFDTLFPGTHCARSEGPCRSPVLRLLVVPAGLPSAQEADAMLEVQGEPAWRVPVHVSFSAPASTQVCCCRWVCGHLECTVHDQRRVQAYTQAVAAAEHAPLRQTLSMPDARLTGFTPSQRPVIASPWQEPAGPLLRRPGPRSRGHVFDIQVWIHIVLSQLGGLTCRAQSLLCAAFNTSLARGPAGD